MHDPVGFGTQSAGIATCPACADFHFSLHYVITIYQCYRRMDRRHSCGYNLLRGIGYVLNWMTAGTKTRQALRARAAGKGAWNSSFARRRHDTDTDTDILARILADTSGTRAISRSYSCGKMNDTPTFSRRSSRRCRRRCRCRRRGMRSG